MATTREMIDAIVQMPGDRRAVAGALIGTALLDEREGQCGPAVKALLDQFRAAAEQIKDKALMGDIEVSPQTSGRK